MKLNIKSRTHAKKSDAKRLRREGMIPAIIYRKDKEGDPVSVDNVEFQAHLRGVTSGHLPTTIFSLTDGDGKARQAIVKDIQYNPVNYNVIHLDFEELQENVPLKVKVPIRVVGEADSVGVKLGGVVRLVIRHVKIECQPKDIPSFFEVDVRDLNLGSAIRLKDIAIPNNVRPLANLNEVAISMVKR